MKRRVFGLGLTVLLLAGGARADEAATDTARAVAELLPPPPPQPAPQEGLATWYGGRRWHGRRTASGEPFDRHGLTAAHRSLPLGSRVRVVNLDNGREVHVRINDRGPRSRRFVIDLSEAAARRLGFRGQGSAPVRLHPLVAPE
jgi:rare lipoprotein A